MFCFNFQTLPSCDSIPFFFPFPFFALYMRVFQDISEVLSLSKLNAFCHWLRQPISTTDRKWPEQSGQAGWKRTKSVSYSIRHQLQFISRRAGLKWVSFQMELSAHCPGCEDAWKPVNKPTHLLIFKQFICLEFQRGGDLKIFSARKFVKPYFALFRSELLCFCWCFFQFGFDLYMIS